MGRQVDRLTNEQMVNKNSQVNTFLLM